MQTPPYFHNPPWQEIPFVAPHVWEEQDRVPTNTFNDNIKPCPVKIIFQKGRIVLISFSFVLAEAPDADPRSGKSAYQDKSGFHFPIQGRKNTQHTASQGDNQAAVPLPAGYLENEADHDHPHDVTVNHAEVDNLEATLGKGEQDNPVSSDKSAQATGHRVGHTAGGNRIPGGDIGE
jgi:hypothetical protein